MTRTFIETAVFSRQWAELGLSEEDLRQLQNRILDNPKIGAVIPGTGGVRKVRLAFPGRGKSGSGRVCYVDFAVCEVVFLMAAYGKGKKENLTDEERNDLKKLVALIEKNLQ
ncbi:MAG: type II toxin-antitoxin system RelE/ParE family toxin [Lachnospiraceae bacterium]|nr:type II toxin-antitoxin system RelE/ParE family toxin [Lachnospiraceae bacterium]